MDKCNENILKFFFLQGKKELYKTIKYDITFLETKMGIGVAHIELQIVFKKVVLSVIFQISQNGTLPRKVCYSKQANYNPI